MATKKKPVTKKTKTTPKKKRTTRRMLSISTMPVAAFMKQEDWGFGCNAGVRLEELVTALCEGGVRVQDILVGMDSFRSDPTYSDTLYVKLGKKASVDALCAIVRQRPDECHVEDAGWVRLWWD